MPAPRTRASSCAAARARRALSSSGAPSQKTIVRMFPGAGRGNAVAPGAAAFTRRRGKYSNSSPSRNSPVLVNSAAKSVAAEVKSFEGEPDCETPRI